MDAGYRETVSFKSKLEVMIHKKTLELVWVLEDVAVQAWKVFEQFNVDKQWSFTDCTSFVVMKQRSMMEAFTFDHHFAQMGFIKLPLVEQKI